MEQFSDTFCARLTDLMRRRRDMRHVRSNRGDEALLRHCPYNVHLEPFVGL